MMLQNAIDLTGQRFGRWTVIEFAGRSNGALMWDCRCDCGSAGTVRGSRLRSGEARACGCIAAEKASERARNSPGLNLRHGGRFTPEYQVWSNMKDRCNALHGRNFSIYAGRGIKVCDRWNNSFAAFFADMGPRPSSEHSIDRINNDGNYEPGNCRWATRSEQNKNRRPFKKNRRPK